MKRIIKTIAFIVLTAIFLIYACTREKPVEKYYRFGNTSWNRFNKLQFEFPVKEKAGTYDIYFDLHVTKSFSHEALPLNMILNTPSGEERIREYEIKVQNRDGSFVGVCKADSCCVKVALKKGMLVNKTGVLKIEIENLTPRLETNGILSAGIILVKL